LITYLDQRIVFYQSPHVEQLHEINSRTAQLQIQLWSAVEVPAAGQPIPLTALVVAGMNDVVNSQGYTQASWWNRISSCGGVEILEATPKYRTRSPP
jgi:hypothetical protein